ncbi:YD repeat protein [Anaeromyxobacter dehalogenans 2CP-1]|uniref:YD repeat protein n=1 Tax=Anaeromyxobacter dehalogenans (strain ATCC BAA-258 / DSM 21875 / 2CP-1) TaxID=455488 RepID=B8JCD4_ANAD2|nr:RHS domain-containing protein [Anaeromyxobacter dehalogenans]ACL65874.1 YD repeat protein [Anaeromyxobacter dehalogenans 2CP-1]
MTVRRIQRSAVYRRKTPVVGRIRFAYDARGNLLQRTTDHVVVTYSYDGLDRVRTVAASDTWDDKQVSYEHRYDERGHAGLLTTTVEPDRVVEIDYDAAGRQSRVVATQVDGGAPIVTEYGYDVDGYVETVTYPSGLVVKADRDPASREIRKLSTSDGTIVFADAISRWPGGPLKAFVFGNGQSFSQTVNLRYEPASIRSGPLALDYMMTASGDVSMVQDGGSSSRFAYDFRDRLIGFSPGFGPGSDLTHRYASSSQYTSSPVVTDRIRDSGVPGASGFALTHAYDYDWQTNVSSIAAYSDGQAHAVMCLRHDPLGRLTLVGAGVNSGGDGISCARDSDVTEPTARFKYDAQGRRIARWVAVTGQWTHFVFGPAGELLSELVFTNDPSRPWMPLREYVWLDGRPLAQLEYTPSQAAPRPYYFHLDHIGMPRALSSPEGVTVWSAATKPYGEVSETMTPDPATGRTVVTNLRLPGQYDERLLGSLGLQGPYYNWNRWYLPGVGRYLELDPIASRGFFNSGYGVDWYGYAGQNAVRYTDRRGLYWAPPPPWWTGIGAAIGTGIGIGIGILWPAPTGGDPCENSPRGCAEPGPGQGDSSDPGPGAGGGAGGGGGGCPPKDPCRVQYEEATVRCADWYTSGDDAQYDACMERAWKNYIRCINGLPWKQNP